jgi:hypothetical protein
MFQQPAENGDKVPVAELINSLVLIWVREHRTGITTTFGEKDAVDVDLHVLDGPHGGETFDNALLFQGALIGSLKAAVGGDPVLARIGVGVGKPGQNPPYVLNPFTEQDGVTATSYLQRMRPPVQQPPPAAAAPPVPTPAPAAPSPAAATQYPAAASPATGNTPVAAAPVPTPVPAAAGTAYTGGPAPAQTAPAVDYSSLPPEVQELLRQSGQMPAAAG